MALILAIETSCDETSAAVVRDGRDVLSTVVASQIDLHRAYGGVFPEMASRQHVLTITPVIREALLRAGVSLADLAAIAVVHGPGLAGSLLVGLNAAKALAFGAELPLVGVNHIEAHIYANWIHSDPAGVVAPIAPAFPLVCLIVSGGHTELVLMTGHHEYRRLGGTVDDAAGEAFDKVARLLGLGYPGGPIIEKTAQAGNPLAFSLPTSLRVEPYDFSFSGIKTAVLHAVQDLQRQSGNLVPERGVRLVDAAIGLDADALPVANLAASFQHAVVQILAEKTVAAATAFGAVQILLAGGVAANQALREAMTTLSPVPVRFPPIRYCTDNAAMAGVAGYYRYVAGLRSGLDLDIAPALRLIAG
ncbi:MAG: tRNA (adenosine(37)-N6)-threonylcarbamoyltransferase complex transferase subunit TsaD [Anaerolineales bacterium]